MKIFLGIKYAILNVYIKFYLKYALKKLDSYCDVDTNGWEKYKTYLLAKISYLKWLAKLDEELL